MMDRKHHVYDALLSTETGDGVQMTEKLIRSREAFCRGMLVAEVDLCEHIRKG